MRVCNPTSLCLLLAAWVVGGCAARTREPAVPLPLRLATDCMFAVLKTVPGVSEPSMGISTSDGWTHTFLEYRATEHSSETQPIRFSARKSDRGGYWFMAVRSGFGVDLHVTEVVMKEWKAQCGVDTNVLFP
jgi:hypothetical protein